MSRSKALHMENTEFPSHKLPALAMNFRFPFSDGPKTEKTLADVFLFTVRRLQQSKDRALPMPPFSSGIHSGSQSHNSVPAMNFRFPFSVPCFFLGECLHCRVANFQRFNGAAFKTDISLGSLRYTVEYGCSKLFVHFHDHVSLVLMRGKLSDE